MNRKYISLAAAQGIQKLYQIEESKTISSSSLAYDVSKHQLYIYADYLTNPQN